jgi:polysaccharide deacetylase family protein (PEP-CTERM system associated)
VIFTVDVEDWFTNGRSIQVDSWEHYHLNVEENVYKILDLLEIYNSKGTFFILGWIAQKRPKLIRDIHKRGHEIASHGYAHRLVYTQTYPEFRQDIKQSRIILEDIIGNRILGYRAPCFSITKWAYEILQEEGFLYSSSIVPGSCHPLNSKIDIEGMNSPYIQINKQFYEFPLPTYKIFDLGIPWGGGGYFRLYPYFLYKKGFQRLESVKKIPIFYIHPDEIDFDPESFNKNSGLNRLLRLHVNKGTYKKLIKLLNDFKFTSFRDVFPEIVS